MRLKIMPTTYPLHIAIAVAAVNYPTAVPHPYSPFEIDVLFTVSTSEGKPLTGLHQSHLAIAIEGPFGHHPANMVLTGSEQDLDSSGNPVFDPMTGFPVTHPVPGPVQAASLPGCYRQALFVHSPSIAGRLGLVLAIDTPTDRGRSLAVFDVKP
jgi:hypothetical protein